MFDEHIAAVCGMSVIDHLHFGRISPGIREDAVGICAATVRAAVTRIA
jgi:NAD(P)H dehydrogenase (quinone)